MSKIKLSIATTDYDHFRDFRMGEVRAEGIDHNWLNLGHHECFARFTANREFDVSELSFAKFTTQVSRDNPDVIGLPVICMRYGYTRIPHDELGADLLLDRFEDIPGAAIRLLAGAPAR